MEQWIKAKYERRQYAMREMPDPDSIPAFGETQKPEPVQVQQPPKKQEKIVDLMNDVFETFELAPAPEQSASPTVMQSVPATPSTNNINQDIMSMFNTPAKTPVVKVIAAAGNDSFWNSFQDSNKQQPAGALFNLSSATTSVAPVKQNTNGALFDLSSTTTSAASIKQSTGGALFDLGAPASLMGQLLDFSSPPTKQQPLIQTQKPLLANVFPDFSFMQANTVQQQQKASSSLSEFASLAQPQKQQPITSLNNQFNDFNLGQPSTPSQTGFPGMSSMGSGFTNQQSQNKPLGGMGVSNTSFGSYTQAEASQMSQATDDWGAFQ